MVIISKDKNINYLVLNLYPNTKTDTRIERVPITAVIQTRRITLLTPEVYPKFCVKFKRFSPIPDVLQIPAILINTKYLHLDIELYRYHQILTSKY